MRGTGITSLALSIWAATSLASPMLQERTTPISETDFSELQRAAKLSNAAYAACYPTAFDVTVTHVINNNATDTQGFIGYSDTYQRITVSMRGSTTGQDFINDGNTTLVYPALSGVAPPSDVLVIGGLYLTWASVHSEVITEVSRLINLYPNYTVESTGHSLGGALTYMSYIALAQNFPNKTITSNALAAFSIGNQAFADFGTAQTGVLRRGNNLNDGVPNVYTQFIHYGTEYYGNGTVANTVVCDGELDTACSAGDGVNTITAAHLYSFGIPMGGDGCADV